MPISIWKTFPAAPRRHLVDARVALGRGRSPSSLDLLADIGSLSLREQIETNCFDTSRRLVRLRTFIARSNSGRIGDSCGRTCGRVRTSSQRWGGWWPVTRERASTRLAAVLADRRTVSLPATYVLVEPLSAKEREVLQLFPTHLSTVEMAGQLFVSASTVRTHVKAIYRKLEVNSRSEAVVRAQALGLTSSAGTPARS